MEDELPPATIREKPTDKGVRFNVAHMTESANRAADNYAMAVGVVLITLGTWMGIIGTLLS
jgi:hypothetical protein